MCTDAIQRVHHSGRSQDGSWSGWGEFWSGIFVDDAIFAESDIGNIPLETVGDWESARRGLFGMDSISRAKVELEGYWSTDGLILGFDIDTAEETISAPVPKVDGAMTYLLSQEFVVGSQHVTLKALQTLRGYMQHWLVASMFWASCVQPLDLLTYGSGDCLKVSCSNFQIWCGYWDMLRLRKTLARGEEAWSTLFKNSMTRNLALHRRFSGTRISEEVSWITTDATPKIIGIVDWRENLYTSGRR